jgi:ComF family protein
MSLSTRTLYPVKALLNLVYPELCVICREESRIVKSIFCVRCLSKLPFRDISQKKQELFVEHFSTVYQPEIALALFHLNPQSAVARMIHQLKYHNRPHLGIQLGAFLGACLKSSGHRLDFDAIVPVPLHEKKQKIRGYNQSEKIARGLSNRLKIEVDESLLIRKRFTVTQTSLNKYERQKNMEDAFRLTGELKNASQHILLIDDVLTTGSTLGACASVLQRAGLNRLSMMTLALGD